MQRGSGWINGVGAIAEKKLSIPISAVDVKKSGLIVDLVPGYQQGTAKADLSSNEITISYVNKNPASGVQYRIGYTWSVVEFY